MDKVSYLVKKEDSNITIKELLKKCHVGRPTIEKIRVNKASFINGSYFNLETIIHENDIVDFYFEEEIDFVATNKPLDIVYEDDYLLLVNKPSNMIIHPDDKSKGDTLVNLVANYYKNNNINRKVRYIHRIDKETTGLVMFSKDFLTEAIMIKAIEENKIDRYYLALVEGDYSKKEGIIKLNIAEDRHINNKMCISKSGKEAITIYKELKAYNGYSLVEFKLVTGRTHQIRVHTSYNNHPILGDVLYGSSKNLINRVALHSYKMEFIHPITNKPISIECPLNDDMKKLV